MAQYDNAIIHVYPMSPWIAKAAINIRCGDRIMLRLAIRDEDAASAYLLEHFPGLPFRTVIHY